MALAAIRGEKAVSELAQQFDVHANQITSGKTQLQESAASVSYKVRPVSAADLILMRRIDEQHLDYPFAGSRMLKGLLTGEGHDLGRLHVVTLMKRVGLQAIYRRPNLSKPELRHKIYPYLLRKPAVTKPNQVCAIDMTYIPMARGFAYLAAVVDWFSLKILSWRLSITMDVACCIEAVEEALVKFGKPEISNAGSGQPVHHHKVQEVVARQWHENQHRRQECQVGRMPSLNASSARSNTRKSICAPAPRLDDIWHSTTHEDRVLALAGTRLTGLTSISRSQSLLRHDTGKKPLIAVPKNCADKPSQFYATANPTQEKESNARRVLIFNITQRQLHRGLNCVTNSNHKLTY